MATTSSPAAVSCSAMIEPVQPRPMTTALVAGSLRAMSRSAFRGPFRPAGNADRRQRVVLVVVADVVAIVVARAGEADHLPRRHVLVAAIDGVGEEAFHGVLQQQLEKAAPIRTFQLRLA